MKKTAFLTFVLALVLVFSLSLFACNKAQNKDDDTNFGTEKLALTQEEGLAKLDALGAESGYEIEFDYVYNGDKGYYKVGQQGNTYWCYEERNGVGNFGTIYVFDDDYAICCDWNGKNSLRLKHVYAASEDLKEEKLNAYKYGYEQILYYASAFSGSLKAVGDVQIADRTCSAYKYCFNTTEGKVATYDVAVDKEYGFTVKFNMRANGDDSVNVKIRSFISGESVVAPL